MPLLPVDATGARSYRHVESILKHGLDRLPLTAEAPTSDPRPLHASVRGPLPRTAHDRRGPLHADRAHARPPPRPASRAMVDAYRAQLQDPPIGSLSLDERVGLLVEAEHLSRDNRKLQP